MALDLGYGFTHGKGRSDPWSRWNSGADFVDRGLPLKMDHESMEVRLEKSPESLVNLAHVFTHSAKSTNEQDVVVTINYGNT